MLRSKSVCLHRVQFVLQRCDVSPTILSPVQDLGNPGKEQLEEGSNES